MGQPVMVVAHLVRYIAAIMDRSIWPVRKRRLHDPDDDSDLRALSAAARVEMVWQLTLQAWGWKGGLEGEPRLSRDVVRVTRLRG